MGVLWNFQEHFRSIAPKAVGVSEALARLLPNLGGASRRARRLYANVAQSVILYGAPIWAEELARDRRGQRLLGRAQSTMCLRIARGYRTVYRVAAGVLAGQPPLALLAQARSRMYWERKRAEGRREAFSAGASRRAAWFDLLGTWREISRREEYGRRVLGAVEPVFEEFYSKWAGRLTFRTTQLLTEHGVFGSYLHRIGREDRRRERSGLRPLLRQRRGRVAG